MSEPQTLLEVKDLSVEFKTDMATVRAVSGMDLTLNKGEVVGLVGESGCGKSATSLAIMGLLPEPVGYVASGSVALDGTELTALPRDELRKWRGRRMAMIFQDPMTSLNPYLTIGDQLAEVLELHRGASRKEALSAAADMLSQVGIPEAASRLRSFPHEFSGGMRQRVMIAMALLGEPDLLIADEPTTALDVTTQAQILELMMELREKRGLTLLIITHDLGVVASTCDRVVVMYAGRVVEEASARQLFARPAHPYTSALLRSIPRLETKQHGPLAAIAGLPPRLDRGPFSACTFAPRCAQVKAECKNGEPELTTWGTRKRRCILAPEEVR